MIQNSGPAEGSSIEHVCGQKNIFVTVAFR